MYPTKITIAVIEIQTYKLIAHSTPSQRNTINKIINDAIIYLEFHVRHVFNFNLLSYYLRRRRWNALACSCAWNSEQLQTCHDSMLDWRTEEQKDRVQYYVERTYVCSCIFSRVEFHRGGGPTSGRTKQTEVCQKCCTVYYYGGMVLLYAPPYLHAFRRQRERNCP